MPVTRFGQVVEAARAVEERLDDEERPAIADARRARRRAPSGRFAAVAQSCDSIVPRRRIACLRCRDSSGNLQLASYISFSIATNHGAERNMASLDELESSFSDDPRQGRPVRRPPRRLARRRRRGRRQWRGPDQCPQRPRRRRPRSHSPTAARPQATLAGVDVDGDLAVLTVDTGSAPGRRVVGSRGHDRHGRVCA